MSWAALFTIQIVIGALIGGVTNELAIRMLFRPYKAYYIGKWRIPFTPGLIPKRHDELAYQMGKLVENFLITPAAVRKIIFSGNVEEEVAAWLLGRLEGLTSSEKQLGEFLNEFGISLGSEAKQHLSNSVHNYFLNKAAEFGDMTWEQLLPNEAKVVIRSKLPDISGFIIHKIRLYIRSEEGERVIKQMLQQLTGGLGMFGGLAGMFLSDEKVVAKVGSSLQAVLEKEELHQRLDEILSQEMEPLFAKKAGDLFNWVGEEHIHDLLERAVHHILDFDRLESVTVGHIMKSIYPYLQETVPAIAQALLRWVEANLDRALRKINLTKIASSQVETFPVNKLEEMIVSITGKELKMITVIGAILGAIIGAAQAFIVLLGI